MASFYMFYIFFHFISILLHTTNLIVQVHIHSFSYICFHFIIVYLILSRGPNCTSNNKSSLIFSLSLSLSSREYIANSFVLIIVEKQQNTTKQKHSEQQQQEKKVPTLNCFFDLIKLVVEKKWREKSKGISFRI